MQVLSIAAPTAPGDGRAGRAVSVDALIARDHEARTHPSATRGHVDVALRGI